MSVLQTPIIAVKHEGYLSSIFDTTKPHDLPSLEDILTTMAELAFLVETVAHMQGYERSMLPTADKARRQIAMLQPRTVS